MLRLCLQPQILVLSKDPYFHAYPNTQPNGNRNQEKYQIIFVHTFAVSSSTKANQKLAKSVGHSKIKPLIDHPRDMAETQRNYLTKLT